MVRRLNSSLTKIIIGFIFAYLSLGCFLIIPDPPPTEEAWPSWAPNSQQLVYECYLDGPIREGSSSIFDLAEAEGVYQSFYTEAAADLCVFDFDQQHQTRLIQDKGGDWSPTWSPVGSHIAYWRQDGLYLISSDGSNKRRLVSLPWNSHGEASLHDSTNVLWSPDGSRLLFSACLDYPDRDIYVVDVNTGVLENLTSAHRTQEVAPMWVLNGTKVVFLSTASSLSSYSCTLRRDAPHQLKVIDADGRNEKTVYNKVFFYAFISATNSGQIIFVADLISKTGDDYYSSDDQKIYELELEANEPVPRYSKKSDDDSLTPFSLSSDGKYLAYKRFRSLKTLDLQTGETIKLPLIEALVDNFVWSPDGQRIAVTTSIHEDMAGDEENHIYIFEIDGETVQPLLQ